jgi:hypothetical protein
LPCAQGHRLRCGRVADRDVGQLGRVVHAQSCARPASEASGSTNHTFGEVPGPPSLRQRSALWLPDQAKPVSGWPTSCAARCRRRCGQHRSR